MLHTHIYIYLREGGEWPHSTQLDYGAHHGADKQRLKYSSKPIKEIVYEFDFPSASFFGKYVKKHTGMSPGEYRKLAYNGAPSSV
ncbi:MAG: AraC family transcriptional regulator [Bacteroides sp.]|nr:AraC family transcriptional regulator [Bacteroides sp.]